MTNLRRVDLNLLVILDTLLREHSVTRAAGHLGLSQSAVSHALRRLRLEFDDPLLIRGNHGMELTWRAERMREKLRIALAELEVLIDETAEFVPIRSTRHFHISVSDYVSDHLLAQVCAVLSERAPGVRLQVDPFSNTRTSSVDGDIQVRLASDIADLGELRRMRVLDDQFSVMMRKGHRHAKTPMTLEHYLKLSHVKVSASAVGGSMIDDALGRRGLARHVAVQLPNWAQVRPIVQATDLVAAIPRHWAADPAFRRSYVAHPLPLKEVRLAIDVIWNRHHDNDPAHQWMRELIVGLLRSVLGP